MQNDHSVNNLIYKLYFLSIVLKPNNNGLDVCWLSTSFFLFFLFFFPLEPFLFFFSFRLLIFSCFLLFFFSLFSPDNAFFFISSIVMILSLETYFMVVVS